jgi:hypothetical protein
MELAVRVHVEELPEGVYLGTSDEVPGLVAQGRTVAETLEIARDVAARSTARTVGTDLGLVCGGATFGDRFLEKAPVVLH